MFGKKTTKTTAKIKPVFVDLDQYEVPNDKTITRIKVAEPGTSDDAERICRYIGTGDLLVIDMSGFDGSRDDRETLVEILHSRARSENYSMVSSGSVYIIAPSDVSLKKI